MLHFFSDFLKKWTALPVLLINAFTGAFAQQCLAQMKADILTVRGRRSIETDLKVDAVADYNGCHELWAIERPDSHTEAFRAFSYKGNRLNTETYIVDNGKLMYALAEIKRIPFNHFAESV